MGRPPTKVTDLLRPLAVLFCLALLAPAAAVAQAPAPQIDGSPLNVWTTADGRVQVALDGAPGEFYSPGSAAEPGTTPTAGFGVVLDPSSQTPQSYGAFSLGALPTPDSGPDSGPGSVTTTWTLADSTGAP